jgi:hypothetical protein
MFSEDDLLSPDTPLIFTDGTEFYNALAKKYKQHKVGYYILAPSGAGKTYFVNSQKEKHWLDGDLLWMGAKAHPDGAWWLEGIDTIQTIARRSDVITEQAKKLGFWVIGADKDTIVPDAIVLPPWEKHQELIRMREKGNYDGGATSADFDQVLGHRKWIEESCGDVPRFESVVEATAYLAAKAD